MSHPIRLDTAAVHRDSFQVPRTNLPGCDCKLTWSVHQMRGVRRVLPAAMAQAGPAVAVASAVSPRAVPQSHRPVGFHSFSSVPPSRRLRFHPTGPIRSQVAHLPSVFSIQQVPFVLTVMEQERL